MAVHGICICSMAGSMVQQHRQQAAVSGMACMACHVTVTVVNDYHDYGVLLIRSDTDL